MLQTIDYIRYESYAVYEMLTPTQRLETAHAQIRIEVQIPFAKPIVFFTTLPEAKVRLSAQTQKTHKYSTKVVILQGEKPHEIVEGKVQKICVSTNSFHILVQQLSFFLEYCETRTA